MICPLTRAHLAALVAYILFLTAIFVDVRLAPYPLILFIVVCIVAPFFPRLGFYLPIIRRWKASPEELALTFDDGPDPETTPLILELLDKCGVSATFFVTGAKAERYPAIVKEIVARGHAVGNHSFCHSPFLMLKGMDEIRRDIIATQRLLGDMGVVPLVFKPPFGITGPRLWRPLLELGMFCATSSGCGKGRRSAGLANSLLQKVAPGDILQISESIAPRQGLDLFLREVTALIDGLHERGLKIVPLGRLIDKEVMLRHEARNGAKPVEQFYNDLASTYDHEQFETSVSISKRKEWQLFTARLPELFGGAGRVLEVGAGTGIFTIPIARHCREVVAVDISRNMLGLLEKKAASEGIANIRTVLADAESMPLEGTFSAICAFASLEYFTDLPSLLRRFGRHLEPGGVIYFITARRSFLRFFIQLGNAMRQGVWLKARGGREIGRLLQSAGFEGIEITSHLFKVFRYGGMLMEVVARRPVMAGGSPVTGAVKRMQDQAGTSSPDTLLVIPVCGRSRSLRHVVRTATDLGLAVLIMDAGGDEGDLASITDLPVECLRIAPERGKGGAILAGAALAKERGYGAIVTVDADGRDDPTEIPRLLDAARNAWPAIVVGAAEGGSAESTGPSSGGLSAFLVRLECGQLLSGTGSAFRLYPVEFLTSVRFLASRRGMEIETLVRGAWAGLPVISVPVAAGRASAGSRGELKDKLSLALLHALLITRSLFPWPHRRLVPKSAADNLLMLFSDPLRFFRLLCREHASAAELAAAAWVGIFIGALPIIPFGLVTIAYVNHKLHLNKLAGMAASNVCVFPFVPFLCVEVGYFFRFGRFWSEFNRQTMVHELHYRLWEWLLGSLVVGPLIGLGGALLTYLLVRKLRRGE